MRKTPDSPPAGDNPGCDDRRHTHHNPDRLLNKGGQCWIGNSAPVFQYPSNPSNVAEPPGIVVNDGMPSTPCASISSRPSRNHKCKEAVTGGEINANYKLLESPQILNHANFMCESTESDGRYFTTLKAHEAGDHPISGLMDTH